MSYLKIDDISVSFYQKKVLENISLDVNKGEIIALIGPSGCGKTTLLNVLSGLLVDDSESIKISGDISLEGKSIFGEKGMFPYMFQEDRLIPWKTILANLQIVDDVSRYPRTNGKDPKQILKDIGLEGYEKFYPSMISGGMKKRAALARTFYMTGEIFLLDEPFSSIDYYLKLELENQLFQFLSNNDKTALLVTHDFDSAVALADKIILLNSSPMSIKNILDCSIARKYNSTFEARRSEIFFNIVKELMDNTKMEIHAKNI